MVHWKTFGCAVLGVGLVSFGLHGCISSSTKLQTKVQKTSRSCIEGQVIGQSTKPLAGVKISTQPKTSIVYSGSSGLFRICAVAKVVDTKEGQRIQDLPIPAEVYQGLVVFGGYKAKPIQVHYDGKTSPYLKIAAKEREMVLLGVVGSEQPQSPNSPGVTGPGPKGKHEKESIGNGTKKWC